MDIQKAAYAFVMNGDPVSCERFGGGGHPGAGGATSRLSLEETARLLEEYMLEA